MKRLPIGVSDFKELIENEYYYVDKSLFIKEVIDDGSKVILIPRPRRFGKTLNMSMLRYFFQKAEADNKHLFKDLNINKHESIMMKQGKYPVIYLTFKDEKYSLWQDCKKGIRILLRDEYIKNKYLLESEALDEVEKKDFRAIMTCEAEDIMFSKALKNLCKYIYKHHNERVVILIDEYDVPIQSGYLNNYYNDVVEFIRNILGAALKDNEYLEKGVLTGILRIAKESIFSGLNNLNVYSLLKNKYSDMFGFLETEVIGILKDFEIEFELEAVKKWYNGYVFGDNIIYNPWSILNFIDNGSELLKPYWINTSSNDLVKMLITKGGEYLKKELEDLIKGNEIVKQVNEDISMEDIDKATESVWSFLLFSGYLKPVKKEVISKRLYYNLRIPNLEVEYLYEEIILSWFSDNISNDNFNFMLTALTKGDIETFEDILSDYVIKSFSYFDVGDESEKFYHAFVLGILVALSNEYEVKSNRESGYGRYDIMLIPKDNKRLGIIIEFKKVNKRRKETLEKSVDNALVQLQEKNYKQELMDLGIKNILELGIAFEGKDVMCKIR
ncbi:MAG: AAA family ATPase [Bacillota bacterium]|nr:AAA family ATPase [Bacillota bacterium]